MIRLTSPRTTLLRKCYDKQIVPPRFVPARRLKSRLKNNLSIIVDSNNSSIGFNFVGIHRPYATTTTNGFSIRQGEEEDPSSKESKFPSSIVFGPQIEFDYGKLAYLAEKSVLASSGETVAFATIATSDSDPHVRNRNDNTISSTAENLQSVIREASSSNFVPLTVDYRQRHHGVGKIPTTSSRMDRRAGTSELLVGRAIDRSLRPLLKTSNFESIHLTCSIQACPMKDSLGGNAVSVALNAASAALHQHLQEQVAGVYLCLLKDGTVIVDPSTKHEDSVCELLYAGTRKNIVMLEFSGKLPESKVKKMLGIAHDCIQPILDNIGKTRLTENESKTFDEDDIRLQLGLTTSTDEIENKNDRDNNMRAANAIYSQALEYCKIQLFDASMKAFGVTDPAVVEEETAQNGSANDDIPTIHQADEKPLVPKSIRGKRERILREEVTKLLKSFTVDDSTIQGQYEVLLQEHPKVIGDLIDSIHTTILSDALREASSKYQRRADGRHGCKTIRPIHVEVPGLPDVVHGSSIFSRGETQVLCTVTVGPPKDGILMNDPFNPPRTTSKDEDPFPFQDLPVGSLRYLRTQEFMLSDMNTRKIQADREQTGDSGQMKERSRAFLQYDFPAYSKGEVPTGYGAVSSRREVGHGALIEKSIFPVLPQPSEFPYVIRMTSEVTSSNGSSSMASVCGATLALLDGGVPVVQPVAGVSVGLVLNKNKGRDKINADTDFDHKLLLDITGTEDYLGSMDLKIAGTTNECTAIQLDVKEPLPISIVHEAMILARDARVLLLNEMDSQASKSSAGEISGLRRRSVLKDSAPRVEVVRFDPMRKKDLLGPGGVVIRQMEDRFNVSLDLTQEGQCLLYGDDKEMVRAAMAAVMDLVSDVEVGGVYEGTVIEIRDFGAIIELLRNKEGLCHVSELANRNELRSHPEGALGLINSILTVGKQIQVECTAVDPVQGTIRLKPASLKELRDGQ